MANTQKKQINFRVILTNAFMVVSILAIAAALTLVAMGYRLEGGELTQYGLLQVASIPSGAGVEIDGGKAEATEMSKMLPGGEHGLVITKPGYDTWRGDVEISSGLLSRVDWVRLFPVERELEPVREYPDLRTLSIPPTRAGMLVERQGATWTMLENTDGRTVVTRDIEVPAWAVDRDISVRRWNRNGDKLFVKIESEWGMIDTKAVASSTNISQAFSMTFEDIALIDDAGTKLYALENGNIRIVDLESESVSGVKISGVVSIGGSGELVGYTQVTEGKPVVGVYRDGEATGEVVFEPEAEGARVRAWQYWGEDIVAAVIAGELVVVRGEAYEDLAEVARVELDEAAASAIIDTSPSGRFVLASSKVVNTADGKVYDTKPGRWLDDYLMYEMRDGKLVVWDFNGGNEREIGAASATDVMVSRNDSWLYYTEQSTTDAGATIWKILRERL